MKKIMWVFLGDAKRITTNVVAIVIIMGLTVLPVLYAWFNIMSNWDPYGESATSEMHIAVFSEDEGIVYGKLQLNVGDTVVDGLKSNKTIGWKFTDTREDAIISVKNGQCYAAFIIPSDFTQKMISFLAGEIENPIITYYENSKKNAIATKITSKVKTTVQTQVNTSIVSTLTKIATKSGEVLTNEQSGALFDKIIENLEGMKENLDTYVNILGSLSLLTDSAGDLINSTQSILPSAQGLIDGGQNTISGLQGSVLAGADATNTIKSMVDISLDTISSSLDSIKAQIEIIDMGADYMSLSEEFDSLNSLTQSTLGVLENFDVISNTEEYKNVLERYTELADDIETFTKDQAETEKNIKALRKSIKKEIKECKKSVDSLKHTFDYEVAPNLQKSVYSVEAALVSTQTMLANIDADFPEVDKALQAYKETLRDGTSSIKGAKKYVVSVKKGLDKIINGLKSISSNEQYKQIVEILKSDPTLIAEFVSSPIAMETRTIYKIGNYGSAMAPFYTVLAIWVSGLISVALVKVKVKENQRNKNYKFWHKYFGRYILFFLIGQASTLICVLGDLFYIGIQCYHPVLFWLASACTSFMFTIFMYSLTVAFGNVGQAIAVVVMVIQVAGAGGTFPVEVLPEVYQMVYKYLPFTYAMNALRECVGGLYHFDYAFDLGVLGIYVLVSVFIGLVLSKPFAPLNAIIEKSKEKSGVMM